MSSSKVVLGFKGIRYEADFAPGAIRIGSVVYVVDAEDDSAPVFSLEPVSSGRALGVIWMAKSEPYYVLSDTSEPDEELVFLAKRALDGRLADDAIVDALRASCEDIRPEHAYKTKEHSQSHRTLIATVCHRIDLCRRLASGDVGRELFIHYRGLVCYLLLTCFDRLGQPSDWLDFGSWLSAGRCRSERECAVAEAKELDGLVAQSAHLYQTWIEAYGVKQSFIGFIRSVLPGASRDSLFQSIKATVLPIPGCRGEERPWDNEEKERFLLRVRNDYTHSGLYSGGVHPSTVTGIDVTGAWSSFLQEFSAETWVDISVRDWPQVLDCVVRDGLAEYMRRIIGAR